MLEVKQRKKQGGFDPRTFWQARYEKHGGSWHAAGDRRFTPEQLAAAADQKNQRLTHILRRYTGDPAGKRLIDAGCGFGQFANHARLLGAAALGVDFCPAAIAEARRRFPDCEFEVAALAELDLPQPVDLIVCADTLINQVDDDEWRQILEGFARLLTPNGRLFVLEKLLHDFEQLTPPPHVRFRTHRQYREQCLELGLEVRAHEWMYFRNLDLWEDILVIGPR